MASLLTFACASILSFSLLLDCSFAASSPSVSSFSYGDFSDVYPSGYTLPPSPSLTGIFASEASAEAAAASKASSAAQASSSSVDEHLSPKNMYLDKMCSPISSKGVPDQDYPCNKAVTLASTCVYGEDYANKSTRGVAPPYPPPKDRSAKDQQQCLCPGGKGQDYFQFYIGCNKCIEIHGGATKDAKGPDFKFYPTGLIEAISSKYCAQATPTVKYLSFVNDFIVTETVTYGTETGGVDHATSKTDVGLYFTSTPIKAVAETTSGASNSSRTITMTTTESTVRTVSATSASATSSAGAESLKVPGILGAGILGLALAL